MINNWTEIIMPCQITSPRWGREVVEGVSAPVATTAGQVIAVEVNQW